MKRQITVTLSVRVELPTNANAHELMEMLRNKAKEYLTKGFNVTMEAELVDRVTVKLVRKEIQYA